MSQFLLRSYLLLSTILIKLLFQETKTQIMKVVKIRPNIRKVSRREELHQ